MQGDADKKIDMFLKPRVRLYLWPVTIIDTVACQFCVPDAGQDVWLRAWWGLVGLGGARG
jgi:hypothetical protein